MRAGQGSASGPLQEGLTIEASPAIPLRRWPVTTETNERVIAANSNVERLATVGELQRLLLPPPADDVGPWVPRARRALWQTTLDPTIRTSRITTIA